MQLGLETPLKVYFRIIQESKLIYITGVNIINRSFSTDLNLCPVDNTIGFPNTYQPDIKWIIRWTVRTIKLLNRPGAGRHSIGWRTILKDNPLSPKSDQHEIFPCKINSMLCKTEWLWGLRTWLHTPRLIYLIFYQLLVTTSLEMRRGNKWEFKFWS